MAGAWRSSRHGSTSSGATSVRSVLRRPPTCRPGPGSRRATSGRPSPRSTMRGSLVRFRDEAGRELLDLPDAPRPGEDAVAPPRLLPMWDEILLGFRDRTRVISDEDRAPRHQPQRRRAANVPRRRAGRWVLVGRAGRRRDTGRARAVPSPCRGRPARARGRGRPAGPLRRAAGARRLCPLPDVRRRAGTSPDGWSRLRELERGRDSSRRHGWTARSATGSSW